MVVAQCLQTERCSEISSSLCFSCAMMGLQATSGKRKLEGGVGCMDFDMDLGESPSKLGRIDGSWWAMDDSYGSSTPPQPALGQSQATNTTAFYELESSCLQSANPCQLTAAGTTTTNSQSTTTATTTIQQQQQHQSSNHQTSHYYQRTTSYQAAQQQHQQHSRSSWGQQQANHYEPPTIRREENGKSYLELGSSYRANERCCEGSRSSWCRRGRACYRQRRLAVLNISMCKLARYRQFPDPSLHRSVLICNTLRYLEREMERDRSPPPQEPVHMPPPMAQLQPPEQGRLTPFPVGAGSPGHSETSELDSGLGDSDDSRSINWGSVLSLSSQSPLDPLNNNELLDVDIGPDLDLDFMPSSWKLTPLSSAGTTTTSSPPSSLSSSSSSSSNSSSDELLRLGSEFHQHHHLQSNCSNNGAANQASSNTHESLMCVGS